MAEPDSIEELSAFERFVLLVAADLDADGGTPFFSYDVRERGASFAESLESEMFDHVGRREVINALSALEAARLIEEVTRKGDSPVGKGRPGYQLTVDRERAVGAASDEPRLESIVERVDAAPD